MSSTRVIRSQQSYNQFALARVQFTQVDEYPPNLSNTTPRSAMTLNPQSTDAPLGNALLDTDYNNTGAPKEGPRTQTVLYRFNTHSSDNVLAAYPDVVYNIPSGRTIVEFTPTEIRIPIVISLPVNRPADETWSHNRIWGPGSNNELSASYQQYFYNNITQRGGNANSEFITDISGTIATMISVGNNVQTISPTAKQVGVDTVAGGWVNSFIHTGGNPGTRNPRISIGSINYYGVLVIKYEATNHSIDGLSGDTAPVIQSNFTLFKDVKSIYNASCNIQTNFSLSENSISTITGVEATLENNFSLSVSAKINRFATISLITQADLLSTTFNFRYADPLSLQSDYSLTALGNIIRNLSSELILSTDTISTQTGGLIYDISVDYTWDDFAIDGKFTDNLLDGGIQYTWDGVDYYNWGTWPNDNWDQTDISWDEWPSDSWNGSERIVTEFNTQNTGNAKRGGIGSLLSTTALSENAAKLKTGASTLISDFLCDGSPSGKMGGSSTMVSNFIVDSFANYIINNAQNIDGAFNATLLANYIAKFLWSVRSDFNLDITPTFKPSGVTNAQCIAVVDALANYKINNPQNIESAFDPIFTARLFFTTDPYQIYRVLQETRQIFVDAESRGIEIPEEIRLNSIPAENRDWLVPQETRNMKLRIPPMVDRTTTPKVRRE